MFTMKEYIEKHGLGVGLHDSSLTREIAKHLHGLGYTRKRVRRGNTSAIFWVKGNVDKLAVLRGKLDEIKFAQSLIDKKGDGKPEGFIDSGPAGLIPYWGNK